jgi:hypothetical protein
VAAVRKVSRAGFRREDCADAGMVAAQQSGAAAVAVVELVREQIRDCASGVTATSLAAPIQSDPALFRGLAGLPMAR